MKNKLAFTLLALLAFSSRPLLAEQILVDTDGDGFAETVIDLNTANDGPVRAPVIIADGRPICGGADDDQLRSSHARLCGGADDDQIVGGDGADFVAPVLNGLPTAPLGSTSGGVPNNLTSVQAPYKIAAPAPGTENVVSVQQPYTVAAPAPGTVTFSSVQQPYTVVAPVPGTVSYTSVQQPYGVTAPAPQAPGMTSDGGGWTVVAETGGNDRFALPENQGIVTDPFQANGGSKSIVTGAGAGGAPHISGNSLDNLTMDTMILQLMTTGSLHGDDDSDTLWGGGGVDEIVIGNPSGGSI